jgi:hypothetical protein
MVALVVIIIHKIGNLLFKMYGQKIILQVSINKNRSTSYVGGFFEICAPSWICSEPHSSLKLGREGTKGLSFQEDN